MLILTEVVSTGPDCTYCCIDNQTKSAVLVFLFKSAIGFEQKDIFTS